MTAAQAGHRLAASEHGRQSRALVRGSTERLKKLKFIGLAQGPSRRKSQELQEWELETGDKAAKQVQGPSRRQNWRPAHQYHGSSRSRRLESDLSWCFWAPGQKV